MVQRLLFLVSCVLAAATASFYSFPGPYIYSGPSYYSDPYPLLAPAYNPIPPLTAVVDLKNYNGGDEVSGRITLTQIPGGPVFMMGNVSGLSAGEHGMHIHELGDLSKGCDSLGAHFNPTLTHHGGPADPYRHVGDLGNIKTGEDGVARISESDHIISLTGPHSILGRGLVIHSGKDDYGRGGDRESLRTGNSGTRVACGVISWAMPAHARGPNEQPSTDVAANGEVETIERLTA